ncbi:MAG TPA: FG-GAP-like repeat-containing protein [Anaerolineales bacterium]|jgi:hypothetical protein
MNIHKSERILMLRRIITPVIVMLVLISVSLLPGPAPTIANAASCAGASFGSPVKIPVGLAPGDITTADFNEDGMLDLAIPNYSSNNITVLFGSGSGAFGSPTTLTGGGGPDAITVADLNNDRHVDLAVANQASNDVSIFLGDGTGQFIPQPAYALGDGASQPVSIASADFNMDGKADLVTANLFNSITVLVGNGSGGVSSAVMPSTLNIPTGVVVGDFNEDGKPDIVAAKATGDVELVTNSSFQGTPNFYSRTRPGDNVLQLTVGDFNRDGHLDLAGVDSVHNQVRVFLGKGFVYDYSFPFGAGVSFPVGDTPTGLASGDINGDGNPDLVVSNRATDNLSVLLGDGLGGFGAQTLLPAGDMPDQGIAMGDFDGNGSLDLAVENAKSNDLTILLNNCPLGPIDIVPNALEVTQSIQDVSNSVVLVAGKRTFVRAHTTTNVPLTHLTARLYGFDASNNLLGGPLWPINPSGFIDLSLAPNRANMNDSFLFELPPAWTSGQLTLKVEVNPFHVPNEANFSNNTLTSQVTFQTTKALNIKLINYQYYDENHVLHSPRDKELDNVESFLRRILPVSKLAITRETFLDELTVFSSKDYVNGPDGDANTALIRLKQWRETYEPNNPGTIYLAIFDRDVGGKAENIPGWNAVASNAEVAAHEIGHDLGQHHVQCTPDPTDEAVPQFFPYPGGKIGGPTDPGAPSGTPGTKFYGFDAGDFSPSVLAFPRVISNTVGELMSYCSPRWLSDYIYTKIHTYIQQTFTSVDPFGDFLSVYGTFDPAANTAKMQFVTRLSQVPEIPPLVAGPLHIRLFNGSNNLLADYPFTPVISHVDDATGSQTGQISQVVNFISGTRRITIYSDTTARELDSLPVSANPPVVSVPVVAGGASLPANGPVTITWTGSDPDNDLLTATVLYSADNGANWQAFVSGVPGGSITLDTGILPGTAAGSSSLFKVIVSDGVLTASAVSSPLTVGGKAPTIHISNPLSGSYFVHGQTVSLVGFGLDLEDGLLDDSHLEWVSDLDGVIGNGHQLATSVLSNGKHTLTLRATDSSGLTTSSSVVVNMVDHLSPGSLPVANAGLDQTVNEGDTVTLDATGSNDPDGDALTYSWSLVSGPGNIVLSPPNDRPTFVAPDDGTYVLRLSVTDGKEGTSSDEVSITVSNVAPAITQFSGTDSLAGPLTFTPSIFTTYFTDQGRFDTWLATFSYPDGTPLAKTVSPFTSGDKEQHQFATTGCNKLVSVTVRDDDGGADTATTTVSVGKAGFLAPLTNQPFTDRLRNGQVLPVKVQITDCNGVPVSGLIPAIRLVAGDQTSTVDDGTDTIIPQSTAAADASGVMRYVDGYYLYNLKVAVPKLNADYTIIIYPYATSPTTLVTTQTLRHVIQATK